MYISLGRPYIYIFIFFLKVRTWTAIEVVSDFSESLCFLKILLASDIPVLHLLYEMVLRCNNKPENLENIVWTAEFYPGSNLRLHRGSNSSMNNILW